jgi:uncharacterized protein YkwD
MNMSSSSILRYLAILSLIFVLLYLAAAHRPQEEGSACNTHTLYTLTNEERINVGLEPLVENLQLDAAAEAKALDMINNHYWDHFRPSDHKAPWDFIRAEGYHYSYAGENLAKGFRHEDTIVKAWMESPAHRENILKYVYKEVGYACLVNENDELYTVQMFGSAY